ncbi:MAG: 5'/3'-nucleotidase SurE [Alphaproteobacteria bacterium]|nr:5'/3'-nucleotidase SurE [Alphaproteobacteria bacterium]
MTQVRRRARWPLDLGRARILVTNDDGIQAPGLKVLEDAARSLSSDVWVVAPETEQSAAGHSLTLQRPLFLREVSDQRYAVDGTPTDCVMLAINHLLREQPPDLVLSGVNRGGNLGEDVSYSGTVAAAMEATLLGVPAVSFSLDFRPGEHPHWSTAEHHAADTIRWLARTGWPEGVLINVNFPPGLANDVKGLAVARQGRRKTGNHLLAGTDPRGRPYYWIAGLRPEDAALTGTDLSAVNQGRIAITPIRMDMSHRPTIAALGRALAPQKEKRRRR